MSLPVSAPPPTATADPPERDAAPTAPRPEQAYIPALDGIRALAVAAVLLYHLDVGAAGGGFLGVEVFFVLSGYLITTLLLTERRRTRRITLRAFWERRARRLLPAVVTAIAVVCALSAVFRPAGLLQFRDDAIASLLYVQNWWAVVDRQPYFEQFGRPSPFMHLWSLAIEEQFYVLWPIALAGALRFLDKAKAFALTLALAGLSVWSMHRSIDILRLDRAYYGTDTRAFGLLLGAALAFVWRPGSRLRTPGRGIARPVLDVLSVAALVGLAWQVWRRSEFDVWTYPWGLLWVDLLSLLLVAAAVVPRTAVARVIGTRPIAAVGRRSYSLYLWHWPVIVFLRPGEDIPLEGWSAAAVRIGMIVVLAELSYRYVERPLRAGGRVVIERPRVRSASRHLLAGGLAASVVVTIAVLAVIRTSPEVSSAAPVTTVTTTARSSAVSTAPITATTTVTSTTGATTSTAPSTTVPPGPSSTSPPALPSVSTVPVSVIGESVTLAAEGRLEQQFPSASVDAKVGRQFDGSESLVEMLAAQGTLSGTVVVHAGNNGPIPDGGLDALLRAAGGRRLILLTVSVPRRWESQVNRTIHSFVAAHPQVGLVDWKAAVQAEPGLVGGDGLHLTPAGVDRYVELISRAVTRR